MRNAAWPLVDFAARLLERDECETVLGDLLESRESVNHGLLAVLGLFLRRQMLLCRGWRPGVAAWGVTLPSSFLLMGVSLRHVHRPAPHPAQGF